MHPPTDIVGLEDGLGVECLSGSGAIASAYSRAFREGFTITLVSGRTVGIGAYLGRLGRRWVAALEGLRIGWGVDDRAAELSCWGGGASTPEPHCRIWTVDVATVEVPPQGPPPRLWLCLCRCVQREDQPIILTGYAALNRLLGRDVYTSHMQVGGGCSDRAPLVARGRLPRRLSGQLARGILGWPVAQAALGCWPQQHLASHQPCHVSPGRQTCPPPSICLLPCSWVDPR